MELQLLDKEETEIIKRLIKESDSEDGITVRRAKTIPRLGEIIEIEKQRVRLDGELSTTIVSFALTDNGMCCAVGFKNTYQEIDHQFLKVNADGSFTFCCLDLLSPSRLKWATDRQV